MWNTAAATHRGSAHIDAQVPCQDRALAQAYDNGLSVAVLADGAGSAQFSHFGAEFIVNKVSGVLADKFDTVFEKNIGERRFSEWLIPGLQWELMQLASDGIEPDEEDRKRLEIPIDQENPVIACAPTDLASTLLAVAVKGNRYLAIHLGDGVIGCSISTSNGVHKLSTLSCPNNGEFANETIFVTSQNAPSNTKVIRGKLTSPHHVVDGFILMSDGPETSLFHKATHKLAPACMKLLDACRVLPYPEMQSQLIQALEQHISQRTTDDCSIAMLAR